MSHLSPYSSPPYNFLDRRKRFSQDVATFMIRYAEQLRQLANASVQSRTQAANTGQSTDPNIKTEQEDKKNTLTTSQSSTSPPKKRFHLQIRYTLDQRKQVWELLRQYEVERVFEMCEHRIPWGTLRAWQKKIEKGETADRKKGSGRRIKFPELEERVFRWFLARRAKQLPVSDIDLQNEAKEVAKQLEVEDKFKASNGWAYSFRKRYNLKYRLRTRLATKSAIEMRELIAAYYNQLNLSIDQYQHSDIWNFDEVRVYFEPNLTKTVEKGCQKNVSILSVGARNMRMTVILMISASGVMAPPVLLYFNKGFQSFSLPLSPDALIASNRSAYNVEATHYEVVLPHFFQFIKDGALVVFDECNAHFSSRIDKLFKSRNINYIRIPGGATCLCQPVDYGIGKKVKNEVKRQFLKWLSDNFEEITTPKGRRKKSFQKPTNKLMGEWVIEGIKRIKPEEILHSFYYTGITSKEYQKTILDEKVPKYYVTLEHRRPQPLTPKLEDPLSPTLPTSHPLPKDKTEDQRTDTAAPLPNGSSDQVKEETAEQPLNPPPDHVDGQQEDIAHEAIPKGRTVQNTLSECRTPDA